MSTDTFEDELDDILGELTADFTKKRKKKKPSSASSTFHKPHDIGAVSDALCTILHRENPPPRIILPTKSSSNNSKRSIMIYNQCLRRISIKNQIFQFTACVQIDSFICSYRNLSI